jgi:hypothetical protein
VDPSVRNEAVVIGRIEVVSPSTVTLRYSEGSGQIPRSTSE